MKKSNFIFAANWKLYKNPQEARSFIEDLQSQLSPEQLSNTIIFGQNYSMESLCLSAHGSPIRIGTQNIYHKSEGAFTGENSAQIFKSMGGSIVLVGHSERRSLFHESDEDCALKMQEAYKQNLQAMLCVGESLQERESGQTLNVISRQLRIALAKLEPQHIFYIAYEPVWAIGTGKIATNEQISEAHAFLRAELAKLFGPEKANDCCILYGGSVKAENSAELSRIKDVNGFLIGGASLKIESFCQIISSAL